MYLAIIVLPLLGSIVSGLLGRKVGVNGAQIITCSCLIITAILAVIALFEVGLNNISVSVELFRWIDSGSLNVFWSFHFDSLTVIMLIPVLIVSCLVHIYSIGYMSNDPHNQRFFSYLSLFTLMMIILVTANNFLLMFVGWEGVGICSYLLVNFWYTRIAANQSSYSAFITNRVGDCFLTIGMFTMIWSFGNIDYSTVFSLAPFINENIVTIIGICLLIGAMAKSSQIGLHVWLPMAMEGPTPVSALIHAATMVTAGVYLLIRSSPLIEYSSTVLILCLWLGAITTIFSSLIGLFQQDIKKVIAYSTMSQLGMMVIAVGLSCYNIALFHLINHAFYKGLLFLGAGAVIHAVADNQDFRKYGALVRYLPLTYSVMLIASLSLVAFPFMTGFYSKDFIIESAYGQFYFSSTVVYFIAIIGAIFTTLYSVKVLYLTFLTKPKGPRYYYYTKDLFAWMAATSANIFIYRKNMTNMYAYNSMPFISPSDSIRNVVTTTAYYNFDINSKISMLRRYLGNIGQPTQDSGIFMSLPLIILAIFSVFFGYITKDIFIGFGSGFFADNSLFVHPSHEILLDTEFAVPSLFKLLPLLFTILFTAISIVLLEFLPKLLVYFKFSSFGYNIFSFFNLRFLIELFYNKYIVGLILKLGGHTTKVLDKGSVELLGPFGLEKGLLIISKNIASLDTGVITSYALYILVGLIFYILLPYLSLSDNSLLLLIIFGLFTFTSHYSKKMQYSFNYNLTSQLSISSFGLDIYIKKYLKNSFIWKAMKVSLIKGAFISSVFILLSCFNINLVIFYRVLISTSITYFVWPIVWNYKDTLLYFHNSWKNNNIKDIIYLLFSRILIIVSLAYIISFFYESLIIFMVTIFIFDIFKEITHAILDQVSIYLCYVNNSIKILDLSVVKWSLIKKLFKTTFYEKIEIFKDFKLIISNFFKSEKIIIGGSSNLNFKASNDVIKAPQATHILMMNSDKSTGEKMKISELLNSSTPSPSPTGNTPRVGLAIQDLINPENTSGNPVNNNALPTVQNGDGFTARPGRAAIQLDYVIDNPHNVNAYLTADGQPNNQPVVRNFAGNILKAMENDINNYIEIRGKKDPIPIWLDPSAKRFLSEFVTHHYPKRNGNMNVNSGPVRNLLKTFSKG